MNISKALLERKLKLCSPITGAKVDVLPLSNHPRISKNWGLDISFSDLCNKCLYCFRIRDKSRDNNKPRFAMSDSEGRIDFVQISNDRYGITVSSVGSMPKDVLNSPNADISKDGNQMVIDYLIETGATDLVV